MQLEEVGREKLEDRNHLLSFHTGKIFEDFFDGIAALEMIERAANRDAGAFEYRSTAKGFWINHNQVIVHTDKAG